VVIPNGTPKALREVVDYYDVDWVLLEPNHPEGLNSLYAEPESELWLNLHATVAGPEGRPVYVLEVVR